MRIFFKEIENTKINQRINSEKDLESVVSLKIVFIKTKFPY